MAFGSNQGNRELALASALDMVQVKIEKVSNIYETEALLPKNAPSTWDVKFLNMVLTGYTRKSPEQMLIHVKNVEKFIGRNDTFRHWAPRVIDIDILFYNDSVINTKNLILPHPELHRREFVLLPLCDIIPNYVHPVYNKTIKTLAEDLISDKHCWNT